MTDLKNKLCNIILDCFEDEEKSGNFQWRRQLVPKLADALIAAGLKFDVNYSFTAAFNSVQAERERDLERRLSAAEHRAEVAEAELSRYTEMIARDDIYHRAERAEARVSELEKQIKMTPLKLFKMRRKKK